MWRLIIFFSSMFVIMCSCKPRDLPTVFKVDGDKVIAMFSYQTTKDDLLFVQNEMAQLNIRMSLRGSEFFKDGRVRILSLTLNFLDGTTGQVKADVVTLQYKYYGFSINHDSPLYIGFME
jgi:hypothetical protein